MGYWWIIPVCIVVVIVVAVIATRSNASKKSNRGVLVLTEKDRID